MQPVDVGRSLVLLGCPFARLVVYDRPTLSMSRIMTAIWARLAASATRVKSLRKWSVEGFAAVGADLGGAAAAKALEGDCCQFVEVWACWWVGDEIGAFIFAAVVVVCLGSRWRKRVACG